MTALVSFSPLAASRGTLAQTEVCISKDAVWSCVFGHMQIILSVTNQQHRCKNMTYPRTYMNQVWHRSLFYFIAGINVIQYDTPF